MQKINLSIPSVHSPNTINFRVPSPDWPDAFLTIMIFDHNSTHFCVELYQHVKNQLVPSVLFRDTVSFRV